MPEETKPTEEAKIEWTDVPIATMPEWTGARAKCRATIPSPGFYKVLMHLPVPTTDEESQAMYGKDLAVLISDGVIAQSYKVKGQIKDHYAPLVQGDTDLIDLKNDPIPMSVFVKVETETKTSEAKKAKAVQEKHGVTSQKILTQNWPACVSLKSRQKKARKARNNTPSSLTLK